MHNAEKRAGEWPIKKAPNKSNKLKRNTQAKKKTKKRKKQGNTRKTARKFQTRKSNWDELMGGAALPWGWQEEHLTSRRQLKIKNESYML